MIVDCIQNWKFYPLGKAWQLAFEFLTSLKTDLEEKKYSLQGDDVFALVMSYKTRSPQTAMFETHRKYLDIQAVISGEEGIEWIPADKLKIAQPYDDSKDVEFYHRPALSLTRINLSSGNFIVLFPQDAHISSLMLNNAFELVKKVVVKVKIKLLVFQSRKC